jgi:hypothetical protein
MAGRVGVRDTLFNWLINGNIKHLNQIFTSFPKTVNFELNSVAGELSRAAVVIYIQAERETRIAVGGPYTGWKRVDYTVVLQIFHNSVEPTAQAAMADFDILIDSIKERLREDHNFGDTTGTLVWQGAEPAINALYGEPSTSDSGATDTFASLEFEVTEMIQA